jgi:hypothetical protein
MGYTDLISTQYSLHRKSHMIDHIKLYLYKRSLRKQLKNLIYSGKIEKITFVSVDGDRLSVYRLNTSNEGEKK